MNEQRDKTSALMNCFELLELEYDPPNKYENRDIVTILSQWRARTYADISFDDYKHVVNIMFDEALRFNEASSIRQKKIDELKNDLLSKKDNSKYSISVDDNYGLTMKTILEVCASLGVKIDFGEVPFLDVEESNILNDSSLFEIYDEDYEKFCKKIENMRAFWEPCYISWAVGIGIVNSIGEYMWISMIPTGSYLPIGAERRFTFHGDESQVLVISIIDSWNSYSDTMVHYPLDSNFYRLKGTINTERYLKIGQMVTIQILIYFNGKLVIKILTDSFREEYSFNLAANVDIERSAIEEIYAE